MLQGDTSMLILQTVFLEREKKSDRSLCYIYVFMRSFHDLRVVIKTYLTCIYTVTGSLMQLVLTPHSIFPNYIPLEGGWILSFSNGWFVSIFVEIG